MTIKSFLKLFIPPIIFKIRNKLKRRQILEISEAAREEKSIAYDYIIDMVQRSQLPFTNLEALAKDYSFEQIGSISTDDDEPNFYGDFWTLEHYADISLLNLPPKNFFIQHGIVTELSQYDKRRANGKCFVWSKQIEEKTRALGCADVWAIGAPFFYADSILTDEQIEEERMRLGRNLLAFPMHSTHFIDKNYSTDNFLKILQQERKRFDTVRVCLYWKDIQRGRAEVYKDNGFEVICTGHLFDQFFLQRQKALFKIADATISNGVGSHIGYSISEGKPHRLIPNNFELVDLKGHDGEEEQKLNKKSLGYMEIINAFSYNADYRLTDKMCSVVDEYWGIRQMKSKGELRDMIYNCYTNEWGGAERITSAHWCKRVDYAA